MATKLNAFAVSAQTIRPGQWESEASSTRFISTASRFFPLNFLADSRALPGYEGLLREINRLIKEGMGRDISIYKQEVLQGHLRRRMLIRQLGGAAEYLEHVREHPHELHDLYQDILVKVTAFFRDRESYDELIERWLPRMLQRRQPGRPMLIWVAGCATGEEAYSLAISLCEYSKRIRTALPFRIIASDMDASALQRARRGIYSRGSVEAIPVAERERYFMRVEDGYRIADDIRETCHFIRHNVAQKPPVDRVDLISCRNLGCVIPPPGFSSPWLFFFGPAQAASLPLSWPSESKFSKRWLTVKGRFGKSRPPWAKDYSC